MSAEPTRRSALTGAGVALLGAVAGFALARNSAAAKDKRGTTAANAYGAKDVGGGDALAAVADLPAGGGLIVDDIVLVHGNDDAVAAFSAVCTHQGCTVDAPAGGKIACPCHGSVFDAATGDVITGPASSPLPPIEVEVRGGEVYRK